MCGWHIPSVPSLGHNPVPACHDPAKDTRGWAQRDRPNLFSKALPPAPRKKKNVYVLVEVYIILYL